MSPNPNFFVQSEYVYRGPWSNWNGGAAGGGRITIHKDQADWINILIGLFVGIIMSSFWRLVAFAWSWLREKHAKDPRHRLFLQQQVVLRNEGEPLGVGRAFIELQFANRRSPGGSGRRLTWGTVLLALLNAGVFLVALPPLLSIGMVENQGIEALIRSPHCGFWAAPVGDNEVTGTTALTNQTWEAVTYVDNCYLSNAPSSLCDEHHVQRRLAKIAWTGGPCPFDDSICLVSQNTSDKLPAVIIQTEALNSHKHLGINAPPDERVLLQRTTTCSPLDVAKFTDVVEGDLPGEEETVVYFGSAGNNNFTWEVSHYKIKAGQHYALKSVWTRPQNGTAFSDLFEPIPELRRRDGDVSVMFLNNNLIPIGSSPEKPCRDPFFSASRQLDMFPAYYWPDHTITAIGCVDQYAFGNPTSKRWTKSAGLGDFFDITNATAELGLSKRQFATLATMVWALESAGNIGHLISVLGVEVLLAKKYPGVMGGFQNPIPDDQWKKEVTYWFDIGLAKLQLELIRVAQGPPDPVLPGLVNMLPVLTADRDDIEDLICSSQRVQSIMFKNFHLGGLLAFLCIGGLVIIAEKFIPALARRLSNQPAVAAWSERELLELHQQLLDGSGRGKSKTHVEEVPLQDGWRDETERENPRA